MESTTLFEMALGLSGGWKVEKADFAGALEFSGLIALHAATALVDFSVGEKPAAADEFARAGPPLPNHALSVALRGGKNDQIAKATRTIIGLQNSHTQEQRAENTRLAADWTRRRHEDAAPREAIRYKRSPGWLEEDDAIRRTACGFQTDLSPPTAPRKRQTPREP